MELKIKGVATLNMIIEALLLNGYSLQASTVWKQFPNDGIDYFIVRIEEKGDKE